MWSGSVASLKGRGLSHLPVNSNRLAVDDVGCNGLWQYRRLLLLQEVSFLPVCCGYCDVCLSACIACQP
jgi:hypothetical protein